MDYQNFPSQIAQEAPGPRSDFRLYDFPVDVYGPAIAELKAEVYLLKKRPEGRMLPIQFLEGSDRLILTQHLIVSIYSSEEGVWIVDSPELNLYGEGRSEMQAMRDFKIVLEETYFGLKQDKEFLGPELKQKWDIFRKIIQEK
ncbi:MAG: hypothetical protein AAB916_02045 [Patescibacteria group bacterium]